MKRKIIPFAAVTAAMVLSMSVAPVSAYFTDHHTASGSIPVRLEPTTEIEEETGVRCKDVTIRNTGDPKAGDPAVWVRMRVYATQKTVINPTKDEDDPKYTGAVEGWPKDVENANDWVLYDHPVAPGESANKVRVKLDFPEGATEHDEYNVVVVYESTIAEYDANGSAKAPDWSKTLDRITESKSNQS